MAMALASPATADDPVALLKSKVNHIVIAMQENHSFDNYFGVLAIASGSPYHSPRGKCRADDHLCVDGLSCKRNSDGSYICTNSNSDRVDGKATVFHSNDYCPAPDLDHSWTGSHEESNYEKPNRGLKSSPNDGFAIVNDETEQPDTGEGPNEDETMGFYNEADLPFYYGLAETFAINDRYFCDVLGPTLPNRSYLMAASSFGHLTTNESYPIPNFYQPITGTIFDLLDANQVSWVDYYTNAPDAAEFRKPVDPSQASHFAPIARLFSDAASGTLPAVAYVDPDAIGISNLSDDEHPPHDIRSGEFFISQIVTGLRNRPNW